MDEVKKEVVEKPRRRYDEGEVLRDLAHAGVKIKPVLLTGEGASTNNPANSKLIVFTKKAVLGIKRLGKVDFLMNFCKGYIGIERE
jgi:hypothetical protein